MTLGVGAAKHALLDRCRRDVGDELGPGSKVALPVAGKWLRRAFATATTMLASEARQQ
jgi:hypothetical protein